MKYLILILFLTATALTGFSQSIKVIHATTGEPMEGVLVIGKSFTTQTGKDGKVDLNNFGENEPLLFQHSSFLKFNSTKEKISARGNIVMLIEDPVRLDEVIVSVNRLEQTKNEIPFKIQQISSAEALRQHPQTTADMLAIKGGVFIQKSQMGGGSPMIRGFSANRLLLVVDGIRMNNAIYRSGNLHNVISLDANSLEQTEIIFGPGSVIYGSDALGGVMSFHTISPRLSTSGKIEQKGKILTRYSSANNEKMLHGHFNFGRKMWAALISTTFSDFGDLRMGTSGPEEYLRPEYVVSGIRNEGDRVVQNKNPKIQVPAGYNQLNLLGKFRFRPSDHFDFNLFVHHSQSSEIPRYDRLIVYRNEMLRYAEWYYGPQIWSMISARLDYRKNYTFFDRLNFSAGFQNYEESRHDRSFSSTNMFRRKEDLNVFSLNFDLGKSLDRRNEIFYGAEAFYNVLNSEGFSENTVNGEKSAVSTRYPDGSAYNAIAGYFSWKYNRNEKLIFQAGARATHTRLYGRFDTQFFPFPFEEFDLSNKAVNGNAGFVWHPASGWQINFSASTGFRSPNIDDVAKVFDSEPGNVIVPNPGLAPEYARNLEASIIRSYSEKAKVEFTVFYTHLKDAMVRRDFLLGGMDSVVYDVVLSKVEAIVNAESARIFGGNISFGYLFTSSFRTRHDFTLTRGKDSDGFPLRHVPPAFGRSHLLFENYKWHVDLYAEFSGGFDFEQLAPEEQDKHHLYAVDENGNPWSPGWWTLNLKVIYQVNTTFNLSGGIENLLDKRYRTYSSGIVAPGINLYFSVGMNF